MNAGGWDPRVEEASALVDEVLKPFVPTMKGTPVSDNLQRGEAFRDMIAALLETAKKRNMSAGWILEGISRALRLTALPWDER